MERATNLGIVENIGTTKEPLFRNRGTLTLPSGSNPYFALGDIDRDGIMDILVSWGSYATHTLIGYKGIGNWGWERRLEWDTLVPWCKFGVIPALGDLNKDGFPDIICLGLLSEENNGSITFFAFENNKEYGFIERQEWASKETNGQGAAFHFFPGSIELIDLDGDSDLDIYYITGGFNCPDSIVYQENIGSTSPVWKKHKEFRISIIPHKIVNFDFTLCNMVLLGSLW